MAGVFFVVGEFALLGFVLSLVAEYLLFQFVDLLRQLYVFFREFAVAVLFLLVAGLQLAQFRHKFFEV